MADIAVKKQVPNHVLIEVILISFLYPAILFLFMPKFVPKNDASHYFITIASSVLVAGLALWAMKRDHIPFDSIGFSSRKFLEAVFFLVIAWVVIGLFSYLFSGAPWPGQTAAPLHIVQQWLFVGMGEELLFRG